jgi:hypothetical protein
MLVQSDALYNDGNCIDGYIAYMKFIQLICGEAVDFEVDEEGKSFTFVIRHGSKEITGSVNADEVTAECVVANFVKPDVAPMRYDLAQNADMLYSKYGLNGDNIVLCQRCPVKDMSVTSFKDMLSEIALSANSTGEHIEAEFPELAVCRHSNIISLTSQEVDNKVDAAVSSVYRPAGSVAFANLPSLTSANAGKVVNVTDAFITTADFVEGSGKSYPAGTNVVIVDVGTEQSPSYKYDVLSGFVDLTGYLLEADLVDITAQELAAMWTTT